MYAAWFRVKRPGQEAEAASQNGGAEPAPITG
jgi:hypothetical protein